MKERWREHIVNNRLISQLNSIGGKRCDSLYSKKSISHHYVANAGTEVFHALLRAIRTFEI